MPAVGDLDEKLQEQIEEAEESKSRLNTVIALSVALTATFMAICNVKAGNVGQTMQSLQTETVDTWSYYQAKSTKQGMADAFADNLTLERDALTLTPEQRAQFDKKITELKGKSERYEKEKEDLKKKAGDLQKDYERLNIKDDQFDAGEASLAVGIALMGVTALTKRRWLLAVAGVAVAFGVFLGLSGFAGWGFRPDWLIKLLGA
jgi:DNA repair ATPase RecN